MLQLLKRAFPPVAEPVPGRTPFVVLGLDGDLGPAMTVEPAAAIGSLVDSDAINPGLERAVAPEVVDVAEFFDENLLGNVRSIVRAVEQPVDKAEYGLFVLLDEFGVGFRLPTLQASRETRFRVVDGLLAQ